MALKKACVIDDWCQKCDVHSCVADGIRRAWYVADINECESQPCRYGECSDAVNMYHCVCESGYMDVLCDTGIYIDILINIIYFGDVTMSNIVSMITTRMTVFA